MPLVALMVALAAAPAPRLKANWSPSTSLAMFVMARVIPTATVRLEIAASVGGRLVAEMTVKRPDTLVADWPSGLVMVIVRAPVAALAATVKFSVTLVGLL